MLGVYECPVCGDSMLLGKDRPFHETTYYVGWMEGATIKNVDGSEARSAVFHGSLAFTALCEECWSALSPESRLPYYKARIKSAPPVSPVRQRAREGGGLEDDPADVERYARETAERDAWAEAIVNAVQAGG